MTDEEIREQIFDEIAVEPFVTAHEIHELCDITPQKASAVLRKMESEELISAKRVKAGRSELKCYFMKKERN